MSKAEKQVASLIAKTPEMFAKFADLKDDELEPQAEISTFSVWRLDVYSSVNSDIFVRAFVNKKSGKTDYQIYFKADYSGDWATIYQASYLIDDELKTVAVNRLGSDVSCGSYSCRHYEDVAFDIPEADLRNIGKQYVAGQNNPVRFRFRGKSGQDFDIGLMPAEAAGVVQRVESYLSEHGLKRD